MGKLRVIRRESAFLHSLKEQLFLSFGSRAKGMEGLLESEATALEEGHLGRF